jgi:hypothetical protein
LDDGFGGDGAAARTAFLVEKIEDFAKGIRVGGVPEKRAGAAGVD